MMKISLKTGLWFFLLLWTSFTALGQNFDTLTVNTTWDLANSPYTYLNTEIVLDPGVTLTIDPGVTIYFGSGGGLVLRDNSSIDAIGTATDSIRFLPHTPGVNWYGIRGEEDLLAFPTYTFTLADINISYAEFEGAGIVAGSIRNATLNHCYVHDGGSLLNDSNPPNGFMAENGASISNCFIKNLGSGILGFDELSLSDTRFDSVQFVIGGIVPSSFQGAYIGGCEFNVQCLAAIFQTLMFQAVLSITQMLP